ncbi:pheromone processing endoprotease [Podospora pseudoanserina]|uniref:Pheromone processing endoprotease n=1 Tax=Podospora pseudoanserina TaxID=2609844 RepID=A0ABR0IL15_9PEZI|nr:pheromone processing endoprotease [Podospora pseudoanserina]
MKIPSATALLVLAAYASASQVIPRNYDANDYYVLHLDAQTSPIQVARSLGLSHEGPLGNLKDHHIFVARKAEHDIVKRELTERRRRKRSIGGYDVLDGVLFSEKQKLRKPWEKRIIPARRPEAIPKPKPQVGVDSALKAQAEVAQALQIQDPIFNEQWHLFNTVEVGHDVNVTGLWLEGITGKNATVAIVDDGLDMYSDDLKDNYYAAGSYDFNDKTEEPKPRLLDDRHGTRCAGEVAAGRNTVCGVGVAYDARISGQRILSKLISDADEAVAMNYDFDHNQIYSCSWGPPDDGKSMDAPGILIKRAMLNAVQNGRQGLGSIYVFASGNGAMAEDNCNFDGYTNSIYSITVGAIDRKGLHPYYSEKCSAGLVVTYSSGSGDAIHTTDVGQNACSNTHGGTSAAAPLAAGIFALVLSVRPDLTWRDMQYLAMDTAIPLNENDGDWQPTTIGKRFSHTYGYGKLDSYAIVHAAKKWKNVKPQAWFYSPWIHVNQPIPQGDKGIAVPFEVTEDMLKEANLERLEHVTVTMNLKHARRGDVSVDLISPNKVVSHLSTTRKFDDSTEGYDDWTFMSVAHWGESGVGTWTIIVKDTNVNDFTGSFTDWHLKLWGESRDASKAKVLPMPTEEDDNDHANLATTTVGAVTTTVAPPVGTGNPDGNPSVQPTEVPSRPIKPPQPSESTGTDSQEAEPENTQASNWLPSFLPSFGMSKATQVWIYGSLVLIVLFCSGLGIYFYLARRKRLRNNPRNEYEFELLDEEEAEGLAGNNSEKGVVAAGAGGRKGRTRGGELYDAFAGGSDDEDEFGGGAGGDERGVGYRDQPSSGGSSSGQRSSRSESGERFDEKGGMRRHSDEEEEEGEQHVIGSEESGSEGEESEEERPLRR